MSWSSSAAVERRRRVSGAILRTSGDTARSLAWRDGRLTLSPSPAIADPLERVESDGTLKVRSQRIDVPRRQNHEAVAKGLPTSGSSRFTSVKIRPSFHFGGTASTAIFLRCRPQVPMEGDLPSGRPPGARTARRGPTLFEFYRFPRRVSRCRAFFENDRPSLGTSRLVSSSRSAQSPVVRGARTTVQACRTVELHRISTTGFRPRRRVRKSAHGFASAATGTRTRASARTARPGRQLLQEARLLPQPVMDDNHRRVITMVMLVGGRSRAPWCESDWRSGRARLVAWPSAAQAWASAECGAHRTRTFRWPRIWRSQAENGLGRRALRAEPCWRIYWVILETRRPRGLSGNFSGIPLTCPLSVPPARHGPARRLRLRGGLCVAHPHVPSITRRERPRARARCR